MSIRNYSSHILILCLIIFHNFHTQAQRVFPTLICDDINFKKHEIPKELNGKFSLIGVAFSPKAEKDMSTWYQPIYNYFIHKQENALFDTSYDINLFFIPMFTGLKKTGYKSFINKIKKSVKTNIKSYLLFYKASSSLKKLQKSLKFKNKKTCIIYVIDEEGNIIEQFEGAFHSSKINQITDYLSNE